ncbi:uncharacterized protein TM35_000101250 [Trypanosoma theileri]|uniref:RNA-editing substrate-binding complex 8 protein HEAT repeats domain-containing protein n=1 Tax=Trypanosoma theileri TaxID=67003 RepID=A0A1X0NYU8_9TRYP|nr:uncharacterized protein TM35_000101250 [Trypanosoma theileri]ORC89857.1 hypothetical protein TM35_000101250 [Trypanosoma theileri]
MLLGTLCRWSKRTPGYVFWRQSTLVELEHAKRSYLLSERPLPIADVARRMVRVKARYLDTNDFHEQNLLRGEYKYFSGKLCDIRHSRPEDMIAYVECGSFFGFWDTAQMDRVMDELLLKLEELGPAELVHLFISLPSLRKQGSMLYQHVARALVDAVPDLSLEECMRVTAACDETTPQELVHNLMRAFEPEVISGGLTPSQAVELMDMLGASTPAMQEEFESLFEKIRQTAVAGIDTLSLMDIAVMCTSLKMREILDVKIESDAVHQFLHRLDESCARSTAMMFGAVSNTHSFSQAMEERVVFLATDFTPTELLSVFRVYMDDFTSMCLVSSGDNLTGISLASSASSQDVFTNSRLEELQFAIQRKSALMHVLQELTDQMVTLLESAASYMSPFAQLQHLEVFYRAVEDLDGNVSQLTESLPRISRCLHLLSAKIIASVGQYTYSELVALLQLFGPLGRLVSDAAVGAAVQELSRRDIASTRDEAMEFCTALQQVSGLRAEYQSRIVNHLLPKLREHCAQDG